MNTSAEVVLPWADGEYPFALKIKQIDELQRKVAASLGNDLAAVYGIGLGDIAHRLMAGRPVMADVTETIRLGLIGGGMPPERAKEMIDVYVDGQALMREGDRASPLLVAQSIIGASMFGLNEVMKDSPVGNGGAATPAESTLRPSTDKDSSSTSHQEKSDSSPSTSSTLP